MEFKVDSQEFKKILTTCIKGYNSKEESSYVLFKIDKEQRKLNIKCRSNTALFKGSVSLRALNVNDNELLEYNVDGVTLKQILSVLPDIPVSIEFSIEDSLVSRVFTVKFPGISKVKLNVESMPIVVDDEVVEEIGEIGADVFSYNLTKSLKLTNTDAMAQDSSQSSVHLFFDKNDLIMLGTNSIVLGEFKIDELDSKIEDKFVVLIKHQQANLLLKNAVPNEVFRLIKTNTMFGYMDGDDILCLVSVVDMPPIEYLFLKGLISREDEIILEKSKLKETLDIFSKLSPQDAYVRICFSKDDLSKTQIISDNEDVFDLPIVSQSISNDVTIVFSKTALTAALQIIDKQLKLIFKQEDGKSSIVKFESLDADGVNNDKIFLVVSPAPDVR